MAKYRDWWFKGRWDTQRKATAKLSASGRVILDVVMKAPNPARIHVIAPENAEFIQGAKELLGKWRHRSGGYWSFDRRSYRLVKALCEKVYGAEKLELCGSIWLVDGEVKK